MEEVTPKIHAGRPRDENTRKAILAATLQLLQTRGYAGLALESVARHAGVGKTTIYRWWSSRAALAVEAFFDDTLLELAVPHTASPANDFRYQLQQLAQLLRSQRGAVLAALLIGARTEPDLLSAIEQRWVNPRRAWGLQRIRAAIAHGDCVPHLDVFQALDTLYTPLYARFVLGVPLHTPVDIDRHCDFLFPVIFVNPLKILSSPQTP